MIDDWNPFDLEHHREQVGFLVDHLRQGNVSTVLDVGCGDGRVLIPLLDQRFKVTGLDLDDDAVRIVRKRVREAGLDCQIEAADVFSWSGVGKHRFDAVLCLGNTLSTILTHAKLDELFERLSRCLKQHGFLVVDDSPFAYWREIAEGNWQEGVSEDGSMQMIWQPGEPIFALRTGPTVDPRDWALTDDDRRGRMRRIWSASDLAWFAARHGLSEPRHFVEGHVIIIRAVR